MADLTRAGGTLRVFPRKTAGTPEDPDVRIGPPGLFDQPARVEISVSFTWDLERATELARQWRAVCDDVRVGGPAVGDPGGEFEPGRFLRRGFAITSRGCPNRCWFCDVWRRSGQAVRELPITDGWILQDDNLLACSPEHIRGVFTMLKRQRNPVQLAGGLEAARLRPWHVDLLADLNPDQLFLAYDTPEDLEPLAAAGAMLTEAFTTRHKTLRAYVLCGFMGDTVERAEERMLMAFGLGFWPYAMLWRDEAGVANRDWHRFVRTWSRPALMVGRLREIGAVP